MSPVAAIVPLSVLSTTVSVPFLTAGSNNGAIKVYSPSAVKVYLGGFCGKIEAGQLLTGTQEDESIKCWNGADGDILYDAENKDALLYLGGAVGIFVDNLVGSETTVTSALRLSYFTNNGDIDVKGTVGCVHIGGLVGRFAKGSGKAESIYFSNYGTTNNGKLTVSATVKSADCAIGGLFGFQIVSFSGASGDWTNNGKLTFTGKVETGRLLVGGITGATDKAFSGKSSRLVNTDDIECTGEVNSASANRVGGIYGQTNKTVANARCFCTIKAYTWIEETGAFAKYTNVGMVVGPNYAAGVNTTNCHVGGKMILDKKWDEDSACRSLDGDQGVDQISNEERESRKSEHEALVTGKLACRRNKSDRHCDIKEEGCGEEKQIRFRAEVEKRYAKKERCRADSARAENIGENASRKFARKGCGGKREEQKRRVAFGSCCGKARV